MYNELYHHGVEGQKWGVKNGPPYPIEKNIKKRYGRLDNKESRQKVIKSKDSTLILEYEDELTNQELQEALIRIKYNQQLSSISKSRLDDGFKLIEDVTKKVGTITNYLRGGIELYKAINDTISIIEGKKR